MAKTFQPSFFKETLRGGSSYFLTGLVAKLLVVANMFLILRLVNLYEYGVYKLVFSVYLVVLGLLLPGLEGLVLNEALSLERERRRPEALRLLWEYLWVRLIVGVLAALVFFVLAQTIANLSTPGTGTFLRLLVPLFILDALTNIFDTVLKFKTSFLAPALMGVVNETVKLMSLLGLWWLGGGGHLTIESLLWAAILSSGGVTVFLAGYFIRFHFLSFRERAGDEHSYLWRVLRTYGKWAVVKNYFSGLIDSLHLWLVKILISTEAVALYSVAASLASAAKKLVPTQTLSILVPLCLVDRQSLADIYPRATKYFSWAFAVATLGSFILVPPVVGWLFPRYSLALPYFRGLVLIVIFNGATLNKQIIYSLKRQKFLFWLAVMEFASVLSAGWLFISWLGLWGAVIESLVTEVLIFTLIFGYLHWLRPEARVSWRDLFSFDRLDRLMLLKLWRAFRIRLPL